MDKVKVKKADLLTAIAEHVEGISKNAERMLSEAQSAAAVGEDWRKLLPPIGDAEKLAAFQVQERKVELHVDDVIELTDVEFRKWVMGEWGSVGNWASVPSFAITKATF